MLDIQCHQKRWGRLYQYGQHCSSGSGQGKAAVFTELKQKKEETEHKVRILNPESEKLNDKKTTLKGQKTKSDNAIQALCEAKASIQTMRCRYRLPAQSHVGSEDD